MQPVIIIPARMASLRLPGKPLLAVGDAPMIVQVWRQAKKTGIDTFVACDGEDIAQAITGAGGKAIITDPHLPSGSDRVFAALQILDPQKKYEIIVNLQGDMPTIDPAMIRAALELMKNPEVDIATLAAPLTEERDKNDPAVVKVVIEGLGTGDWGLEKKKKSLIPNPQPLIPISGRALSFARQPSSDNQSFQHIGLYVYRRAALEKFVRLPQSPLEKKEKLEQLRALEAGMRIEVAIVETAPVGVDTQETLSQARKAYGDISQ